MKYWIRQIDAYVNTDCLFTVSGLRWPNLVCMYHRICPSIYIPLCAFFHVYIPSIYIFLFVYVPPYTPYHMYTPPCIHSVCTHYRVYTLPCIHSTVCTLHRVYIPSGVLCRVYSLSGVYSTIRLKFGIKQRVYIFFKGLFGI